MNELGARLSGRNMGTRFAILAALTLVVNACCSGSGGTGPSGPTVQQFVVKKNLTFIRPLDRLSSNPTLVALAPQALEMDYTTTDGTVTAKTVNCDVPLTWDAASRTATCAQASGVPVGVIIHIYWVDPGVLDSRSASGIIGHDEFIDGVKLTTLVSNPADGSEFAKVSFDAAGNITQ